MGEVHLSDLSASRRELVRRMHELSFGSIEGLAVKGGDPVLDGAPRVVREVKFGSRDPAAPSELHEDFVLKDQWVEFFRELDAINNGQIGLIHVKHGLPFLMRLQEVHMP